MKTIHKISGIFLWCVVGVFLGKSVYTYYDYTAHPGLYETGLHRGIQGFCGMA